MTGAAPADTERQRCSWATSAPEYVAYHDDEWGVPLHGDNELFERMSLEAFQSGLSWITILRKREAFRAAFGGFDIATVAEFDASDADRLMADVGIVRNRLKIDAVLANARVALEVDGGLSDLLWSYARSTTNGPGPWPTCPRCLRRPPRWRRDSRSAASDSSARPRPMP